MSRTFNRCASPADFDGQMVKDLHPLVSEQILQGQHPQRSWEYSQALFALEHWATEQKRAFFAINRLFADVGGASSNFWQTLTHYTRRPITRIDPNHEWTDSTDAALYFRETLRSFVDQAKHDGDAATFDAVFCLSVIEHVPSDDLRQFEQDLCSLLRSGGLLVLTCDAGQAHPDTYHFNWMRKRIYTPDGLRALHVVFQQQYSMRALTPPAYQWDGPTVYDYGIGALAFVKER